MDVLLPIGWCVAENDDLTAFAARLREATKLLRPQGRAAALAGVAVPTWQRYLKGEREPGALAVGRLAAAAGIDLHWLLYGKAADAPADVDEELLREIIELIEEEAARRGHRPDPAKLASLIVHCYLDEASRAPQQPRRPDPVAIRRLFKLV